MPIVYLGTNERLAKEIELVKPILDRKYKEILGEARYSRLADTTRRTLTRKSFFNNVDEVNAFMHTEIPQATANKFLLAVPDYDVKVSDQGIIERAKIRTAPAFLISEETTKYSDSKRYGEKAVLASSIHEFNHFIFYALQRVPMMILNQVFLMQLGRNGIKSDFYAELKETILGTFKEQQPMPLEKKVSNQAMSFYVGNLQDGIEKANQILDRIVLGEIGIRVELPWRGERKTYKPVPIAGMPGGAFAIPLGDPYYGMSDIEAITRSFEWDQIINFTFPIPYFQNFVKSFMNMKISKMSIDDLERFEKNSK